MKVVVTIWGGVIMLILAGILIISFIFAFTMKIIVTGLIHLLPKPMQERVHRFKGKLNNNK